MKHIEKKEHIKEIIDLPASVITTGYARVMEGLQSQEWLMLCELIDNSIASYTDNDPKNPVKGLKIDILLDLNNGESKRLIISDNAKGMTYEQLKRGLKFGTPIEGQGIAGHMYNLGLKSSTFWSGRGLKIKTFSKEFGKLISVDINLDKLERDPNNPHNELKPKTIVEDYNDSNKMRMVLENNHVLDNGTIIEFYDMFDKRWNNSSIISNVKELNNKKLFIIKLLSSRYKKFINDGCRIAVKIKFSGSDIQPYFEVLKTQNVEIPSENINDLISDFWNHKDKKWGEAIRRKYDNKSELDSHLKSKFYDELKKSINSIKSTTHIEEKTFNIDRKEYFEKKTIDNGVDLKERFFEKCKNIIEDQNFNLKFQVSIPVSTKRFGIINVTGFLQVIKSFENAKSKQFTTIEWRGINLYQFNRGINFAPNNLEKKTSAYLPDMIKKGLSGSEGGNLHLQFLSGEFNLDQLNYNSDSRTMVVKPDLNKQDFLWEDEKAKNSFFEGLNNAIMFHDSIFKAVHKFRNLHLPSNQNNSKESGISAVDRNVNIVESVKSNYNTSFIAPSDKKSTSEQRVYPFNFHDKNITCIVKTNEDLEQGTFSEFEESKTEKNTYYIFMNMSNPIWKPLYNSDDKYSSKITETVDKLAILFAFSMSYLEDTEVDSSCSYCNNSVKSNVKKTLAIFNEISKEITN